MRVLRDNSTDVVLQITALKILDKLITLGRYMFFLAFAITWRLSSVVCRPLTFHILIFSSETPSAKRTEIWWEASMEGPL